TAERNHLYYGWMTLDELESFVCIATGAGFTAASRKLHRSQPAISRRIRQLEQSLDAPLFERFGRGVRLTDAGQALLPHAEAVLAAVRDGERAVRELGRKAMGPRTLRLALVGTLADSHIVDALRRFQKRFAGASVELRTANSREVSELVRRGEAHLGVRYHADPDPKLESIALGAEGLRVVVPATHRVRARRLPDLRALEGETWLGFPADPRHPEASLESGLRAAGIASPRVTPVDSLTAQKRLVEAGFGIALLPQSSFREEVARGSLRTIEVPSLNAAQPVVAVRRRGGHPSPLASALLELLLQRSPELLRRKKVARRGAKRAKPSGTKRVRSG
ncbi:MAG: LysR family transcriptional regulator, partial [bacterium]